MRNTFKTIGSRAGILGELFQFLWENKMWWMVPFIAILVLCGVLIVFAQTSPAAPFIYVLF